MKFKEVLVVLFASVVLFGSNARADQYDDDDDNESEFSIGLGISAPDHSIYLGGDNKVEPLPIIEYRSGRFFIDGPGIGYDFYRYQDITLYSSVSVDLGGDRDGSDVLSDMADLDTAFSLNIGAEWETAFGDLEAEVSRDISNTHDGTEVSLGYSIPIPLEPVFLSVGVEASWLSSEVGDYYYGVDANQVRAGRPQYLVDDTWVYEFSIRGMLPLDENWSLMAGVSVETYDNEITDSPIVAEDQITNAFAAVSYEF